jgi:hypothetical protein
MAGIICLLANLAVISRSPIPWLDEVYLVYVANSIAHQAEPSARKDDAYNVVVPGHQRFWALGNSTPSRQLS